MAKVNKVTLSFKSTKRDMALFNFVMSLDDKSFYIKEALRQVFSAEVDKELEKLDKDSNFLDNVDFDALEADRRIAQATYEGVERRQNNHNYR